MGVLGSVSEQGNRLVYCVHILPHLRPVPDCPSQPRPAPGAEGRHRAVDGRGSTHWTLRECPYRGDTERAPGWWSGASEQRRCNAQPGVSTQHFREKNSAEKGCAKWGHMALRQCVLGPAAGGLPRVGIRLLPAPALPRASSLCLLSVAVLFLARGSGMPQDADVVGTLLPLPQAGAHLGKYVVGWEVGFGVLGLVGDLGLSPAPWVAPSPTPEAGICFSTPPLN